MIKIEVMGPGCPKCKKLMKLVESVVEEMKVDAEVVKVEDLDTMVDRGVMVTPTMFIDGEAVSVGRVPGPEEIKRMISNAVK